MPKLQLALDFVTLSQGLEVARSVGAYADIVELGTPFLYDCGVGSLSRFRAEFPDKTLLADLKILDAGFAMASLAFEAGADIVTVSALTWDSTIKLAVRAASEASGAVMADLIGVRLEDLAVRARQLDALGVDYVCAHRSVTAPESVGQDDALERLSGALGRAKLAVAGGVDANSVGALKAYRPDVVIVGGAIAAATDPQKQARAIRRALDAWA